MPKAYQKIVNSLRELHVDYSHRQSPVGEYEENANLFLMRVKGKED